MQSTTVFSVNSYKIALSLSHTHTHTHTLTLLNKTHTQKERRPVLAGKCTFWLDGMECSLLLSSSWEWDEARVGGCGSVCLDRVCVCVCVCVCVLVFVHKLLFSSPLLC